MFDYHFLFFIYAFIYAHDPIPCLITVVLTLQFEWSAESSSWATASHNVISPLSRIGDDDPISTETRSNDCNWKFLYYTKTILCRCSWRPNYWPSSFSAGSTHISIGVSLTGYYRYHRLRLCARWPSSLRCFQVPTLLTFVTRVHACILWRAIYTQLYFVILDPNSIWRRTNYLRREFYPNTEVCRGTHIRQRACVNQVVLRDNWNPSEFESSYDIPYWIPGCCILSPSGGIVSVFCIQANVIPVPHTSGRSCQHWSIQSWIRIHFGRCPGTVVFRSASFR